MIFDLVVMLIFGMIAGFILSYSYFQQKIKLTFTILGGVQVLLNYIESTYKEDEHVTETVRVLRENIRKLLLMFAKVR